MRGRRSAAAAAALGVAVTLGVAVPLATAHRGKGPQTRPAVAHPGKTGAPPLRVAPAGKVARKVLLHAVLNGRNEVDPVTRRTRAGDPDGQGAAVVTIKDDTICFGVVVQGIGTITGAHIHAGKKGRNGPVVLDLQPPAGSPGDPAAFSQCLVAGGGAYDQGIDLSRLRRHPERYYVNVHTTDFPNGAVRGQLRRLSPAKG
jgi:hypothetical protein